MIETHRLKNFIFFQTILSFMLSKKNKDDTNKNNNKIVAVTTVITGARHEKHSICFPETDFHN